MLQKYYRLLIFIPFLLFIFLSYKITGGLPPATGCIDPASKADSLVWEYFKEHENIEEYFDWFRRAFRISDQEWRGFGATVPYNIDYPYAKLFNASMFITYGVDEDSIPWHHNEDYRSFGQATDTRVHASFKYLPWESYGDLLAATSLDNRLIWLSCNLFVRDPSHPRDPDAYNNPASRGGELLHESMHISLADNGIGPNHYLGPAGYCTVDGRGCDYFYFHDLGDHKLFHSPNQIQVEFLSDIVLNNQGFIPRVARELARSEANYRLDTRFIRAVPFRVDEPDPW